MTNTPPPIMPDRHRLGRLPHLVQWLLLIGGSLVLSVLLHDADVPAALLLGPMIVGIVLGTNGTTVAVPKSVYLGAQSVLGTMVGGAMTAGIVTSFLHDWPLVVGVTLLTLVVSSALGWLLCVKQVLPGTAGIWGAYPGAASAMVIMAEAFGADARLVAFMQYVRVVIVVAVASTVAGFSVDPALAGAAHEWFTPFDIGDFALTLALAAALSIIGVVSRLPSGALLLPIIVVAVLSITGMVDIVLPEWFLGLTYAVIGATIGLRFTPAVLRHATFALPKILLAIFVLIAFCAGISVLLVVFMDVDPLTAYLATSPGGLDSVAIIAASTNVDLSFILVIQSARFFMILLFGPSLARMVARRTRHMPKSS
ncbi:AbrB family transcriptional regulator [Thalassospira sp.]|uniref:AbrB family transcriptional regulator n=1 Tax=Thalassospira sp. TaxID=1912094 RepID=UPI00273281C3|nr:AbrB family transcriptional regulator [Thalassospira sp.]MDP2697497.1 AbrB family transcriptional regulator [Thalassospira sp.]